MLKQRVLTAVALLMVLLPALFASDPCYFIALALLFVAAGAWEWARLNQMGPVCSLLSGALTLGLGVAVWLFGGVSANPVHGLSWWAAAALLWVLGGAYLLHAGVEAWGRISRFLRWVLGLLVLLLAWWAMAQARMQSINLLLSILALVWMADVVAYFCGRALGGRFIARKLAVQISPGKSWEGAIGGMVGAVLLAWLWLAVEQGRDWGASVFAQLHAAGGVTLVLSVVFLAALSVVGDLTESLVKRSVGAKDSSSLLPGHGGVLDRVDALLPVLPVSMLLLALIRP